MRLSGRILIATGVSLVLLGASGILLLCLGLFPPASRTTFFPVLAFVFGVGLWGLGWSHLRDADSIEREAARRRERRVLRARLRA